MQYLLYPVAIYVLFIAIQYVVTFLQLCKAKFQYPKYQVTKSDAVPIYLRKLFQTSIKELEQLGFKPCSYLQYQPIIKVHQQTNWELLLYNKESKTYATVVIKRLVEPVNLFDIEFYSFFQDRTLLLTLNGKLHGLIDEIPNTIIQDAYTDQVTVQWQTHQDKLEQLATNKKVCGLAPEAFAKALQSHMTNYVNHLAKSRNILPIKGDELFQLSWLTSLKMVNPILQGNKKASVIIKQRRQKAKTDSSIPKEIPVELEVEGFKYMEYINQGLVGKKFRTWLFFGSFVLFIASYTKNFAPETFAIFMGALMFHEGGHLLAMKLFGYRDTAVLFVPFLGALATARKDDATLTQKFWISIAGPLPGLILGIALSFFLNPHESEYFNLLRKTSSILIFLNLFNLLPIYPLDGGQIADLLLFSRFPYLGVLFKVIGVMILGLIGKDRPSMLLFVGLIAITIPNSFRSAKINANLQKELRKNQPDVDKDKLLHHIYDHLLQFGQGNLPFSKKYILVQELIQRYYESGGKWTTRLLLSLLYCVSLLGGMLGSVQAIVPGGLRFLTYYFESPQQRREHFTKEKQREIERTTAILKSNPNDVNAYIKRSQARKILGDNQGALADYNQVVRLKPNDIQYRLIRANLRSSLKDYKSAIKDYNEALRLNPKNITVYYQQAHLRSRMQDYQGAIADYNTIIKLNPQQSWAYISRGELRHKLKDYKGALADAEYVIKLSPDSPDSIGAYMLRSEIRRSLGNTQGAIADQQKVEKLAAM
ncbi:tetratricopeptide repeat protein [Nostoc sp. CHAB 5844]|nr:tetratricopeptide repeat protein [Nostoc sp. CHAB 5844]